MRIAPTVLFACACLTLGSFRAIADQPDPYAPALDSYYYALQAESFKAFGQSFFSDGSLVAPLAAALSSLTGLPVLAALAALGGLFAAATAFGLGLCCIGLCRIESPSGWAKGASDAVAIFTTALAVAGAGGSAQSYLAREFLKNSMAQALFLVALGIFLNALAKRDGERARRKRVMAIALSAILFAAAALAGIALIAILATRALSRNAGGTIGLARVGIIAGAAIPNAEKWEHAAAFLTLFLWIPAALRAIRSRSAAACLATGGLAAIHAACVIPITGFGWDLLSYRLMLASIPFAAMAVSLTVIPLVARLQSRIATIVGAATLILAAAYALSVAGPLEARRPAYKTAAAELRGIEAAVPAGWSVLAPRGLAGFIWYELGVPTENFQAAPDSPRSYARLAWGAGPAMFRDDDGPLGSRPLRFGPWTLVTEEAWKQMIRRRPNLLAARDGRNELPLRPADAPSPRYELFDRPLPRKSPDANAR